MSGNVRALLGSRKRRRSQSIIALQSEHKSQLVIDGKYQKPLFTREHLVNIPWDDRYEDYVIRAGLFGVHQIGHIPTDHALISALVERWRQETHTFHLPVGEMTITLQDAAVLLGLRVDGDAICLNTKKDWKEEVERLLGKDVTKKTFRNGSKVAINIKWLHEKFAVCPDGADDVTVEQHARAYCLMLVGSLLFTDHSGDSISAIYLPLFEDFDRAGRYSWASAVLAFLYRELCLATKPGRMQFGGSVLLLQLWSWERLPLGRPRTRRNVAAHQLGGDELIKRPPLGYGWTDYHEFAGFSTCRVQKSYRIEIDNLTDEKVIWLPYEHKMDLLPPICGESPHLWRTTSPLIHFWIVEMYNPGRVERQFGMYQQIPPAFQDTEEELHGLKNRSGKDWPTRHRRYVQEWEDREDKCLRVDRLYNPVEHGQYMRWFSEASILYLQRPVGIPNTHMAAENMRRIATITVERFGDVANEEVRAYACEVLHNCKAAIRALLEPVGNEQIFRTFDD